MWHFLCPIFGGSRPDDLEAARAAAPLDQSDIIEDLGAAVRRKDAELQRLQSLLHAAHASHEQQQQHQHASSVVPSFSSSSSASIGTLSSGASAPNSGRLGLLGGGGGGGGGAAKATAGGGFAMANPPFNLAYDEREFEHDEFFQ